jgi:hypothetical protein
MILAIILSVILIVGIIRVCFEPYTGFINLLMECMLLDWMIETLVWLAEYIIDND